MLLGILFVCVFAGLLTLFCAYPEEFGLTFLVICIVACLSALALLTFEAGRQLQQSLGW